ncbi:hypothetical protein WJX84_007716 [Apatococcus fuscideae]|uniref:FAD synthase n=1 Tax=Apatococcus fuscideae TaxID=2026836 RepID=A0AAW1SK44_9CHLO
MEVLRGIEAEKSVTLRHKFLEAVRCIERTLDIFGSNSTALSFNGGKDSTVLLHLVRAAVALKAREPQNLLASVETAPQDAPGGLGGVLTFMFERTDDFKEIIEFGQLSDRLYDLKMNKLQGDFKPGLATFISEHSIRAILIGTRSSDPNAKGQDKFCPSSKGWPPFMRVNAVLDWEYEDVWAFLRAVGVQYCPLYDKGYTSLGAIHNTLQNSALLRPDGTYAPAHELSHGELERVGRGDVKPKLPTASPPEAGAEPLTPRAQLSAAIVIVGDEILSGKVEDVNTRFLCTQLRDLGWQVSRVAVVRDEVAAISAEIRAASPNHEVVLTAGGLGPTHDDVTMAGIADALGKPLERHPTLEQRLQDRFGSGTTAAHLKMAEVPAGEAELIDKNGSSDGPSAFPLMRCRNIYVLPGIPHLLQEKWKAVKEKLLQQWQASPFHTRAWRLLLTDETGIAPDLENIATRYAGTVAVGSYPVSSQPDNAGIIVSLESQDSATLRMAVKEMQQSLSAHASETSVQASVPDDLESVQVS